MRDTTACARESKARPRDLSGVQDKQVCSKPIGCSGDAPHRAAETEWSLWWLRSRFFLRFCNASNKLLQAAGSGLRCGKG